MTDIPKGWKLVPIEPTQEMIDAGRMANMNIQGGYGGLGGWEAMLAAAPAAATPSSNPIDDILSGLTEILEYCNGTVEIGTVGERIVQRVEDKALGMRNMIVALREAPSPQTNVRVKLLEWDRTTTRSECLCLSGFYNVRFDRHEWFVEHTAARESHTDFLGRFPNRTVAEGEAQARHNDVVLNLLDPTPAPRFEGAEPVHNSVDSGDNS